MGISLSKSVALLLILVFLLASCLIVAEPALSSATVAEDTWVSKAPMQKARGSLGVAVVNGKIYAIGGWDDYRSSSVSQYVDYNEEYDPATDKWTFKKPMPTPRAHFGISVYQNRIYCTGGITKITEEDGVVREVSTGVNEVYDPATDTWETKAPMPTRRWALQASVVKDKIYLIGGLGGLHVNEVYDPATDSWTKKTPPPTSVHGYASVVIDNNIYLMGGDEDGGIYSNLNQIYDPENDSWSSGAPAPQNAGQANAGATTGVMAPKCVYIFGITAYVGMGAPGIPTFATQVYESESDSWAVGTSPPTNRVSLGVVVVNDLLYAIGGYIMEMDTPEFFRSIPSAVNEQYTPVGYGTLSEPEPFPTTLIVASIVFVSAISIGLLVYFKKYRRQYDSNNLSGVRVSASSMAEKSMLL